MTEDEQAIEQEHSDFLRKVANEVYELVRDPQTMAGFREQTRLFCEMNEGHQREMELLERASLADSELQRAIENKERKIWGKTWGEMTEEERNNTFPDTIGVYAGELEGFEHCVFHQYVEDVDERGCNHWRQFIGPPAKTYSLLQFLIPPPQRDEDPYFSSWPFDSSKLPNDNEKLMCSYALLVSIHDTQVSEKPIFTSKIYRGSWSFSNKWKCILWESCAGKRWSAVASLRTAGLNDTRAWITRALNDVKADLAKQAAEPAGDIAPGKRGRIKGWLWKLYEKTLKVVFEVIVKEVSQK